MCVSNRDQMQVLRRFELQPVVSSERKKNYFGGGQGVGRVVGGAEILQGVLLF